MRGIAVATTVWLSAATSTVSSSAAMMTATRGSSAPPPRRLRTAASCLPIRLFSPLPSASRERPGRAPPPRP